MDTPYGYCHCGCGGKTRIPDKDHKQAGQIAGVPLKYIKGHNPPANKITGPLYTVEDRGYKTPCWTWLHGLDKHGYAEARRDGKTQRAYRWMYEQKHGPVPEGLHLDHLCRVRPCVNPNHVEPVLQRENTRRGALTKLNPESVREIRRLRSLGVKYVELAERFGVTMGVIGGILNGRAWVDIV